MSTTPQADSDNELGYTDALIICGACMGLAVALIAMKGVFYFFLDMCIELDGGSRRRCVIEFLRKLFPFWHVRTQPATMNPQQQQHQTLNSEDADSRPLTLEQLVATLPTEVLSLEDIREWNDNGSSASVSEASTIDIEHGGAVIVQQDTDEPPSEEQIKLARRNQHDNSAEGKEACNSSDLEASTSYDDSFPCSICLHGMNVGDKVFRAQGCRHIFHLECIAQWIVSSRERAAMLADQRQRMSSVQRHGGSAMSIDCPMCRSKIDH
mmetsp:Transcript_26111/g.71951  ORF Transcript_26111/g.71951 Transcript_26111/m.71951 type:complete len:267 (-) Transcript_26111:3279-4079(-)